MKFSSMRNISVVYKLAAAAFLAFTAQSCKKPNNGIDNNQIISKPYSLFLADSSGQIEYTNDGDNWRTAFGSNGSIIRAMSFSDTNLIVAVGSDAFVAAGKELKGGDNYNFNPISGSVSAAINTPWQSMMLNVPEHDRIYMAGNVPGGVIYSDSSGKRNTWQKDPNWGSVSPLPIVTSFTRLADGKVVGFDHTGSRIFFKTGRDAAWQETKPMAGLPTGGKFFLSHVNNTVVLADSTGTNGVWYSNNLGANWDKYTDLPAGAQVTCMTAPFERLLLVGTAAHGIYMVPLNSTQFQNVSAGLNQSINVRSLSAKSDFYKNNRVLEYVYAATDFGLYRSMDIGRNWILVRKGNFVSVY
ncbi:hypothetical protein [Polluticoccus soli]|uniref:hypothetical protein n=1 Tax=Polluticoccus soli TaxID=3034150 RepID=UPI0023E2C37A|nr:hypothetical protein [Flavipsychrobacter sp. JY13-12]